MPAPLAIPLAPLLGTALTKAAGLVGLGAAKGAATAGTAGAVKGLVGSTGLRMAGGKLAKLAGNVVRAGMPQKGGDAAIMLAPDAIGGLMVGAATPGDLGDKLIAGGASAIGGAGGGILGRGAFRHAGKNNDVLGYVADFGGSIGGDMLGMQVGDQVLRAKGGGMTPYEKMMAQAQAEQRAQIEEDVYRQIMGGA